MLASESKGDLYEELGVARDATVEEIRKAYRERSKSAHPDGGGSAAEFADVQAAYQTLIHVKTRRHYDQTGERADTSPRNTLGEATATIDALIENVLNQNRLEDLLKIDVVAFLKGKVLERIGLLQRQEKDLQAQAARVVSLAGRFSAKTKPDVISPLLQRRAATSRAQADSLENDLTTLRLALAILDDHSFRWDKPTPTMSTGILFGLDLGLASTAR